MIPEPAPVPIAVDNIAIETVILAPIEKRKPGRPRKRQAVRYFIYKKRSP